MKGQNGLRVRVATEGPWKPCCMLYEPIPNIGSPCVECGDAKDGLWHAEPVEGDQYHEYMPSRCWCGSQLVLKEG